MNSNDRYYDGKIGVVIVNYNQKVLTIQLVNKILTNTRNDVVIAVVDNGSNDGSYEEFIRYWSSNSRVVLLKNANLGYAKGNNLGISKLLEKFPDIEFITITNPDVNFDVDIIYTLINKLINDPELAVISPIMLLNDKIYFQKVIWKLSKGWEDVVLAIPLLNRVFNPLGYKSAEVKDGIMFGDVVPGSFFIIKREIAEKIGFFDERTFLYAEERILAAKIKMNGYKIGVDIGTYYLHNHMSNPLYRERKMKKISCIKKEIFHRYHLFRSRTIYLLHYCCGKKILKYFWISLMWLFFPLNLLAIILKCLIKKGG